MRILLDECPPTKLASHLTGHEVTTVGRMRWSGLKNGELLRRASGTFDVFLTIDRGLQHQQRLPEGMALVTLRARSNAIGTLREMATEILAALEAIQPGQRVSVGPGRADLRQSGV